MFRGKFLDLLKSAHAKNRLRVAEDRAFKTLLRSLYDIDWVVYSKEAFAGPKAVLDYFGRYTHRIAISNHRILDVADGQVTFTYRDRKDDNKQKS